MAAFRLSSAALEGLKPLVRLSPRIAAELAAELSGGMSIRLGVEESLEQLVLGSAALSDMDADAKREISGGLAGLHYLAMQGVLAPGELCKLVATRLAPEDDPQIEAYTALLEALLSIRPLQTATKATLLAEDFERIYLSSKVLTDVRPVFDEDLDKPLRASLVLHTIKFVVRENSVAKEVFIVADSNDVRELMTGLERSLTKARSLRQVFAEVPNAPFGPSIEGFEEE